MLITGVEIIYLNYRDSILCQVHQIKKYSPNADMFKSEKFPASKVTDSFMFGGKKDTFSF